MKATIELTKSDVAYIKEFKRNLMERPLNRKEKALPSMQIWLKLVDVVDAKHSRQKVVK